MRRLAITDTQFWMLTSETVTYFVYVNLEIVGDNWVLFSIKKRRKLCKDFVLKHYSFASLCSDYFSEL